MLMTQKRSLETYFPKVIIESNLLKNGGFGVFAGLLDAYTLPLMLEEAVSLYPEAYGSEVPVSDGEEVRGGNPARRFLSTPGGAVQDAFYSADWMLAFLREVTGTLVVPTGARGTYSYYARPGDYLALHRDVEMCDLAVITCLYEGAVSDDGGDGGRLCLYPTRIFEPLSTIRQTPERGAVKVRLMPGQTVVMFGGVVPHALLPVVEGQMRIVSVLCYRVPV